MEIQSSFITVYITFVFLGHVQDRKSIEEVIQFAAAERVLLLADEVTMSCLFRLAFYYAFVRFSLSISFFPLHSRCTRTACMGRTESLFPIRKSCLKWIESLQKQCSWSPSTLYPVPALESEFCLLCLSTTIFNRIPDKSSGGWPHGQWWRWSSTGSWRRKNVVFFKDICNNIILGLSQFSILYNWDIASPAMVHCGPAEVMGPAGAETSGSGGGLQTCAEKIASVWLDEQKALCLKICKHILRSIHVKNGCSTPSSQCLHSPSLAWKLAFAVSNSLLFFGKETVRENGIWVHFTWDGCGLMGMEAEAKSLSKASWGEASTEKELWEMLG